MEKKNFEFTGVSALLAFALLIAGIKLMIIASYGNITPYWDQWDFEADRLFRPFMEGTLNGKDLFTTHNEHRILTGRLLALLLFVMNGELWNPLAEMVVNVFLHTIALLLVVYGIGKAFIGQTTSVAFALFAAILFSIPLGWENILTNNSPLYFVMLFSFVFLLALSSVDRGSFLWWVVIVISALFSYLSFASGVLTIATGIVFLAVQWFTGIRRDKISEALMVALLLLFVVALYFTPTIDAHANFKSKNFFDFVLAMLRVTGGFLLYIPSALFMLKQLRQPPVLRDPSWFLFSLSLWVFSQIIILCYGRSHGVLASRYFDMYAIGFAVNFASLLVLRKEGLSRLSNKAMQVWLVLVFLGIGFFFPGVTGRLERRRDEGHQQEENVRAYLITKNVAFLQDKATESIPYPDPERLKILLDNRTIQSFLPHALFEDGRSENVISPQFIAYIFLIGSLCAGAGAGLFFILLFRQ